MKILRKNVVLVAMLTLMVLALSLCVSEAYAYSSDEYSNLLEEDRQNTKTFIENWIANTYKNDGTELSKITKTYGYNDAVSGYVIDFKKDNMPNGYILLDKQSDNPIKEFALEGDSLTKRLADNTSSNENDIKIYNCNNTILAKNNKLKNKILTDIYNNTYNEDDIFNPSLYMNAPGYDQLIFDPDSRIDYNYGKDLPEILYMRPYRTGEYPDPGNCSVVAAANIIHYWQLRGVVAEDHNEYEDIKRITKFKSSGAGLNDIQALEGLKNYAKEKGLKISVNAYLFDTWNNFKSDIIAGRPIFLGLKPWNDYGHAVVVCGYIEMPSGDKYLRVLDGWDNTIARFMEFKKSNYFKFDGASVEFKK